MSEVLREIAGGAFLAAGAAFLLIGALGIIRMPELFTRIHAASLFDTAGVGLTLVGLMFYGGLTLVTVKLVFLLLFLMFMGPVATHALAAAALQSGLKPGAAAERSPSAPAAAGGPKKAARTPGPKTPRKGRR